MNELTAQQRILARHLFQVAMEQCRLNRNAIDPQHGVHTARTDLFLASLDQLLQPLLDFRATVTGPQPPHTYTRDDMGDAMNAAVDLVREAINPEGIEYSKTIRDASLLDLLVNAAMTLLDEPGASMEDVIEECYSRPAEEVLGWLDG